MNPDSHTNSAQNVFLCLQHFFSSILLDSRNIFSLRRCSEKFSLENFEICIQNRVPTVLKSCSNECTCWNTFWACAVESNLAQNKKSIFLRVPAGFSKIFLAESYLQLKTLRLRCFLNPDPHTNIAEKAFLCLQPFFAGILLDSRTFFSSHLISCAVTYDWGDLWIRILTLT